MYWPEGSGCRRGACGARSTRFPPRGGAGGVLSGEVGTCCGWAVVAEAPIPGSPRPKGGLNGRSSGSSLSKSLPAPHGHSGRNDLEITMGHTAAGTVADSHGVPSWPRRTGRAEPFRCCKDRRKIPAGEAAGILFCVNLIKAGEERDGAVYGLVSKRGATAWDAFPFF